MVLMIHPQYGMDKEAKHKLTHTPAEVKKIKAVVKATVIALLEDILEERLPLASSLEQDFDLLQRIQSNRKTELAGINEMITKQKGSIGDQEQIVSEEEFKFLLSAEEQEQESQS